MVFTRVTKSLRVVALILAVAWMSPASTSAQSATIQNVPPTPHYAPPGTPLADLAEGIKMAAGTKGWAIVGETPGSMTAELRIRVHEATVVILYDESNYQIDYLDSFNLGFNPNDLRKPGRNRRGIKGPRIHRNYNAWVKNLARSIAIQLRNPPKAADPPTAAPNNSTMIADELDKLDALRQRGVLTQQEFDEQKAKLLK